MGQANWVTGGNGVAANSSIGTNTNYALLFETNNIERMRLDNAGRLGVNTTSLTARLNVKQSAWSDWLSLQTSVGQWNFHNPNSQNALAVYYQPSGQASLEMFSCNTSGLFQLGSGWSVFPTGTKLAIRQGWSDWVQLHRSPDAGNPDPNGYFRFHNPQGQNAVILGYTSGTGQMFPSTTFYDNGKVSIGSIPYGSVNVTTPGVYKLYVADGILTEKVKVALLSSAQWADHVFQPNYALMPLEQVGEYIECHGHLPGVPSADEMVKEGVDMVKTDAMLLAKIEELTLYVLQLKKEIELLKVTNQ